MLRYFLLLIFCPPTFDFWPREALRSLTLPANQTCRTPGLGSDEVRVSPPRTRDRQLITLRLKGLFVGVELRLVANRDPVFGRGGIHVICSSLEFNR